MRSLVLGYCETPECRRVALLEYFGERIKPCGNRDVCQNLPDRFDGTEDALKILSAVYRTGRRFGAAHLIDVVKGNTTEKLVRFGHQSLPTFGVGRERSKAEWQSIIRQLVASGFLWLDIGGYGGLKITTKGTALLRGEGTFLCCKDTVPARFASAAYEKRQYLV